MRALPSDHLSVAGGLLPSGAAACAAWLDAEDGDRVHELFPDVPLPASLAHAVPKRRLQYAAGRLCAFGALSKLGMGPEIVLGRDDDRVPVWPEGVTGCISHTEDLVWAAAVPTSGTRGLGIDVERIAAIERARIDHLVCGPEELAAGVEAGLPPATFVALAFSVKESLFKCLFPIVRQFFDYREATVTAVNGDTVDLRLDANLSDAFPKGTLFTGRYGFSETHVFTSVSLPAAAMDRGAVREPSLRGPGDRVT